MVVKLRYRTTPTSTSNMRPSTYQLNYNMHLDLIVQPKGGKHVIKAIIWARENKVAITIKSGGYQYSGVLFTSGKNV